MKKILMFTAIIAMALVSCKDECEDITCQNGGVCFEGACVCVDGYEGENCETAMNAKLLNNYDVTYTGTGALANTNGTTVAKVKAGSAADLVLIEVDLDLSANVLGTDVDLPLEVTVQGNVVGDGYEVPQTSIVTSVDPGIGFPIDIDLTFTCVGTLDGTNLNSTLTLTGTLAGTVQMAGVPQ